MKLKVHFPAFLHSYTEPTESTFLKLNTEFINIDLLQLTVLSTQSKSRPKEFSCRPYVSL